MLHLQYLAPPTLKSQFPDLPIAIFKNSNIIQNVDATFAFLGICLLFHISHTTHTTLDANCKMQLVIHDYPISTTSIVNELYRDRATTVAMATENFHAVVHTHFS